MKKVLLSIFLFVFVFGPVFVGAEEQNKINLYFFYGDGCPHCAKEEIFLDSIEKEDSNITIHRYETWFNKENQQLLASVAEKLDVIVRGVPLLVIGDQVVSGYYSDEITGRKIKEIINSYKQTGCEDLLASVVFGGGAEEVCSHSCDDEDTECMHDCGCSVDLTQNVTKIENKDLVAVPFFGEINPKNFSLPVLTVIMGAIDGFNPCAMWVLLFLINLLLSMKNRRKMWILGSAFLASSAIVYFLFLAAWLNIILFMGFVYWMRLGIALVAIASGTYHLYDYYKNRGEGCKVTKNEKRQTMFKKLRSIVLEEKFFVSLVGIIILAGMVNLVELLCSAGVPAVYVPILTLANVPTWQFYAYLLLYILIYLLDDLVIFIIAMKTLQLKASDSKYMRYSGLVGGVVLLIIGILLVFKPGWLMFG